jgi:hypothetical protein
MAAKIFSLEQMFAFACSVLQGFMNLVRDQAVQPPSMM